MRILTVVLPLLFAQTVYLKELLLKVRVKQGELRGTEKRTWGSRSYVAFYGIPYAEPPVGSRRFQAPVPAKGWNGVLNATTPGHICPQRDMFINDVTIRGNENCLFLNVYTPKINSQQLLPVIVYIHGGGFMADSGDPRLYGPDILLDKDLVYVTMNYRIGALGFLSLEDDVLPGNNGLKDQNLALRWVKENIAAFEGNPSKITIFGNSAGGASVYHHILSPLSKGLFHGAISSSGIATATWAVAQKGEAKRNAQRLAKFLNCPTSSSHSILKCLLKIDALDIVEQNDKFMEFNYDPAIPHKPVIERDHAGAFLSAHPVDILKSGIFAHVPYMNGITTDDGGLKSASIYNNYSLVERLDKDFDHIAPMVLHYDHLPSSQELSRTIRKFYFQDRSIDNNTKAEVTNIVTDPLFYYPQRVTSLLHSKYTKLPVYFYLFGYRGSVSMSQIIGDPEHDYGAIHGDDLTYLLSNTFYKGYNPTESDLKMNDIMTTLWYNFANTGDPTAELNSDIKARWEPVENGNFKYFAIHDVNNIRMDDSLFEDRFEFWEKLGVHDFGIKTKEEL
ncbi:hypothetical protein PPYR_08800 [Photinus pyralis]|uniref:Carboxylesterase type B domain-containing protein n=1 Tax=Photinus pyralis TaxID=7054 RepID=A0A5N4AKG0_PHOPY|nr:venom carboxylesterase-6-like [Photinus pyralis]KAB0797807.1 hypothetical protein PPYR_08800 [Photinus pyralis]